LIPDGVLAAMLDLASGVPSGAFVEVGVYQGGSACALSELARKQNRSLYLYDTFCGIPWKSSVDSHNVGDFADCSATSVQNACPGAYVVTGVFPASAIAMGPVAFAHLDCDQYRSYHEAIDYLLPRMVKGGILWFDDSPDLEGARLAVSEAFGDRLQLCEGKHYVEV
jgi:O-methyltransferase